jgi:hypothetical protein
MKIEVKNNCPLNNFEPCKKFDCAWFIHIRGTDPNTGEELDDWGCSMAWTPKLLIENAIQQRQTGSAVESFRNEMVRGNQDFLNIITASKQTTKYIEQE